MITIYGINVGEHKISFEGLCSEAVMVDRITLISPTHELQVGWVEISVCDHLLYKGPYPWFKNGGMQLALSVYENFKITFTAFDESDKWFHRSNVRLMCQYANGNMIGTMYKGQYDVYVK